MSREPRPVEAFLARVRGVLEKHRLWTTAVWTVAAAASVIVVIAVWYTARGYAAPGWSLFGTALFSLAVGAAFWASTRLSDDAAARAADQLFGLRDAVTSYLHFSRAGRREGMYALQAAQTDARVESLQPESIEYKPPRRGVTLAAGLLLVAVPLSLRGPSAERLSEQKLAEETAAATAVVNKELESLVEELRKEASDDEENSLLDPDKLRRWVDELKETADPKEALRQYATLERKLNEARLSLRNQRDQQLLERAAREMETSRETQALAEQLRQKDYDRSSKTLEKMGPSGGEQPLTRQRRDLARLKAAAQHMAAAARSARSSASGSQTGSSGSEGSGQSGSGGSQSSGGGGSGEGGGSDMAKTMEDLDAAVEDFDDALKEAERQESQLGQCDAKQRSECESCQTDVDDQVKRLCKQLCKLGVCQRAEKRLCKLCKACSQCQSGLCNSSCSGLTPGGKQAGTGSNTARRDAREELADNGQTTQLKGQKGQGPSQTTVEAAEDGSGVSSRRAATTARSFKRQYESFVSREDVPEEVKRGVKTYFEVIHQPPPAAAGR